MSTISSGTTLTTALVQTGDTTGNLVIKTNNGNTTAVTINTAGAIGVGSSPSYGSAGQYLQSAGNAAPATWATVPSTTPGGSTTQVQYNNAGAFGGDSGFVYSSGNVGIGTTSQNERLRLNSSTAGEARMTVSYAGTPISYFGSYSGIVGSGNATDTILTSQAVLAFAAGGTTERMRIDSSGNVGIGTSSPNSRLEVNKAITFSNVDDFAQLVVKSASGATGKLLNIGVDDTNNLSFIQSVNRGTDANNLVLQRYGGNVGIGISPTDTGGFGRAVDAYSATGAAYYARSSSGVMDFGLAGVTGYIWNRNNGNIQFATNNTQQMRLESTGELKFNSGYGSVQTAYGCRAWVNFNASSGTPTIRSSGGVSSLTDNGTGDTTVNLSITMPDANYSVSGTCNWNVSGNFGQYISAPYAQAPTTTTFRIITIAYNGSAYDCYQVSLQFVR